MPLTEYLEVTVEIPRAEVSNDPNQRAATKTAAAARPNLAANTPEDKSDPEGK